LRSSSAWRSSPRSRRSSRLITFVAIAAPVFFFVVKPMNHYLERRKRGEPAPEPSPEVQLLTEIRDLLKAR